VNTSCRITLSGQIGINKGIDGIDRILMKGTSTGTQRYAHDRWDAHTINDNRVLVRGIEIVPHFVGQKDMIERLGTHFINAGVPTTMITGRPHVGDTNQPLCGYVGIL